MTNVKNFITNKLNTIQIKYGNYYQVLNKLITNEVIGKEAAITAFTQYREYKNLLNRDNINFFNYFNEVEDSDLFKAFEQFNDDIHKSIVKSKQRKILRALYSSHNKIINEQTNKLALECAENNISPNIIHKIIGKKVRGLGTSEELNAALRSHLDDVIGGWNKDSILERSQGLNTRVAFASDEKVIIEIKDFIASSKLGSMSWCITRGEEYFNDYTTEDFRRFFFVYDFTKLPEEEDSMLAALVHPSGKVFHTYNKIDDKISNIEMKNHESSLYPIDRNELLDLITNTQDTYETKLNLARFCFFEELQNKNNNKDFDNIMISFFNEESEKLITSGYIFEFLDKLGNTLKSNNNIKKISKENIADFIYSASKLGEFQLIEHVFNEDFCKEILSSEGYSGYAENTFKNAITNIFFNKNNNKNKNKQLESLYLNIKEYNTFDMKNIIPLKAIPEEHFDFAVSLFKDELKEMRTNNISEILSSLTNGNYYHHQNEDWFKSFYEKVLFENSNENLNENTIKDIFDFYVLNRIQNGSLIHDNMMFGLKQFLGKDKYKDVQNRLFNVNKDIYPLIAMITEGNQLQEILLSIYRFSNQKRIDADITLDIVSKIVINTQWEHFEKETELNTNKILKNTIENESLGIRHSKAIFLHKHKDKFDYSKCAKLFNILKNYKLYENIEKLVLEQPKEAHKQQSKLKI